MRWSARTGAAGIIVSALMATAPAAATEYVLSYDGTNSYMDGHSTVTYETSGFGRFDIADGATTVSLGAGLDAFFLEIGVTTIVQTSSIQGSSTSSSSETTDYGLSDLYSFAATQSGTALTSLTFQTGEAPGSGVPNFLASGAPDGSGISFVGGPGSFGTYHVASVPEPTSWLTLIAGFGAIGAGLRHRRRPEGQPARG